MSFSLVNPQNPTSPTFHRPNIAWRPLWALVESLSPIGLDAEQLKYGHYNDGVKVDSATAKAIASSLRLGLQDGSFQRFKEAWPPAQAYKNYIVCEHEVSEFAEFLDTCHGFEIW